jgi:hypothetical protein
MYSNVVNLKDAVKMWATLTLQREFKVVKSSPHIYDVCCLKPNYPFRLYAYKGKWKEYWEVRSVVDHNFLLFIALQLTYHKKYLMTYRLI